METFGLILFIVSILGVVGSFGYAIYDAVNYAKSPIQTDENIKMKKYLIFGGVFTVSFLLVFISIHLWHNHPVTPIDWFWTISGGLGLGVSIYAFFISFIVHYYKKGLSAKLDKILFITLMVSIPLLITFFFFLTNGYADYLNLLKPLAKAIDFSIGLVYPGNTGGNIAFYAICILSGAIFVYFLCDHKMYVQYGKHGLFESTFLIAFPAGIIGARIAYVIGNWGLEFAGQPFWKVFAIWEGGLTILGGAIGGIVVGVLWFMWRNKGYSIFVALDIAVPSILLAQAIGRWGNFFNCEVYGGLVPDTYWTWLPKIIFNNMHFSNNGAMTASGMMHAPLFYIEGLTNTLGYFVLAHLFGNCLKKYTEPGDAAIGYLIWYGFTRVFMEPIRDPAYNMGNDGYWSWFWSIIFVAAGIILIVGNHIIRHFINKKNGLVRHTNFVSNLIGGSSIFVVATALTIIGALLMINNSFVQTISLNAYNIGVVCLVVGVSCYFLLALPLPKIISHAKENKHE